MGYIVGLGLYSLDCEMLFPLANLFSVVLLFTNHAASFERLRQNLASFLHLFATDVVCRRQPMVLQFCGTIDDRIECHAESCPISCVQWKKM